VKHVKAASNQKDYISESELKTLYVNGKALCK